MIVDIVIFVKSVCYMIFLHCLLGWGNVNIGTKHDMLRMTLTPIKIGNWTLVARVCIGEDQINLYVALETSIDLLYTAHNKHIHWLVQLSQSTQHDRSV